MLVAKSYTDLPRLCEPFQENNKWYVNIQLKSGKAKKVRAYTETEYKKMYGGSQSISAQQVSPSAPYIPTPDDLKYGGQKRTLGFDKGYVTIFKGDQQLHKEWFQHSIARYCVPWGWYITSREEVPDDLPYGIEPVRLNWDLVAANDYRLKSNEELKPIIEPILYGESPSNYQGSVGERLSRKITVIKVIETENYYGLSRVFIMEDQEKNQYVWCTTVKNWAEGYSTTLKGTVKEYKTYHGIKQTVLTRCTEI